MKDRTFAKGDNKRQNMDGMISGNKGCPGKGADEERMMWKDEISIPKWGPGPKKNEYGKGMSDSKKYTSHPIFLSNIVKMKTHAD